MSRFAGVLALALIAAAPQQDEGPSRGAPALKGDC
jgi:hypothetical protein